ncbi:MAG: hypothetical protein HZA08_13790 [Nitrospirae bacterium]|nr:hypothetical protein [Nitrospirota bacterium]
MDFTFQRRRLNEMPESRILEELEKAAKHFNYIEFGRRDFDKIASISSSTVRKHYGGSWTKGLEALKKYLQQKGLDVSPRPHAPNRILSDKDLFDEMERIWKKVGQRPSSTEWEISKPKISYGTYKKRFGGWGNACLKFIEYKTGGDILAGYFYRTSNSGDILNSTQNSASQLSMDIPRITQFIPEQTLRLVKVHSQNLILSPHGGIISPVNILHRGLI